MFKVPTFKEEDVGRFLNLEKEYTHTLYIHGGERTIIPDTSLGNESNSFIDTLFKERDGATGIVWCTCCIKPETLTYDTNQQNVNYNFDRSTHGTRYERILDKLCNEIYSKDRKPPIKQTTTIATERCVK